MTTLNINGKNYEIEVEDDMPVLWAIRDLVQMTGTKYGCGIGQCGACTILMDGKPVRSCSTLIANVKDKKITTVEGLHVDFTKLQKAWEDLNVPQCGYCQSGQLMSAAALIKENRNPSDADIDVAMSGNICRCGTYQRIKKAIKLATT